MAQNSSTVDYFMKPASTLYQLFFVLLSLFFKMSVSAPVCGALHAVEVFCSLATALWLLPTQTKLLYF